MKYDPKLSQLKGVKEGGLVGGALSASAVLIPVLMGLLRQWWPSAPWDTQLDRPLVTLIVATALVLVASVAKWARNRAKHKPKEWRMPG